MKNAHRATLIITHVAIYDLARLGVWLSHVDKNSFTVELSHSTVVVHLPGLQEVWVQIPPVELIFPSFFPSYLSSSPSDIHTPPFFQSIYRVWDRERDHG